jgi:uncharacterized membrane protein
VRKFGRVLWSSFIAGVLVLAPIYLAALLLLKAMSALASVVKPLAKLLPDWLPRENMLALLLIVALCLAVGLALRTPAGSAVWQWLDDSVFQKLPGYSIIRGFTQQLAGGGRGRTWKPALAEIEEALVPAFIIEELADGQFTVFVPSAPTPFAGAIYILTPDRVHPADVPMMYALRAVSRWGSGCKDLVAAIDKGARGKPRRAG